MPTFEIYPAGAGTASYTIYDTQTWNESWESDVHRGTKVGRADYYQLTASPIGDYTFSHFEVDVLMEVGSMPNPQITRATRSYYTSPTSRRPNPIVSQTLRTTSYYKSTGELYSDFVENYTIEAIRVYFDAPEPPPREYIIADAVVTQDEAVAQGCYATVNGSRGTVEVDCPIGSSVTLSLDAHAAGDYVFDHWSCNTARIEGGASTTYTALNDSGIEHLTFTATFRDRNGHVTVTAHVSPDEAKQAGASAFVNGVNSYTKECAQGAVATFTLSAHPTDEWQFVAWIAGGETFDDETATLNHRNVTGEDEVDATAYFEQVGEGILCDENDGTILCTDDSGAVLCGG